MRTVGLFRELAWPGGNALPSILEAKGKLAAGDAKDVLDFLRRGIVVFDYMEAVEDPFDPTSSIPGGSGVVSDGVWAWRIDLEYFVERYGVELPVDFIEYVRRSSKADLDENAILARGDAIRLEVQRAERGE